jgi:hypothetical protein
MLIRLKHWVAGKSREGAMPQPESGHWQGPANSFPGSAGPLDGDTMSSTSHRATSRHAPTAERPKILVALEQPHFPDCILDYTVHLAERLHYDILALHVGAVEDESTTSRQRTRLHDEYRKRTTESADTLKRKASARGIHCEHLVRFGDLATAVGELHYAIKRIEFVITDSEDNKEDIFAEVTIPVFSVTPTYWWSEQGGKTMAKELAAKKSKPVGKTILFGLGTVAMYAAVFTNTDTIMKFFTRGGWYAALPIATVFVFSFVHGAFASNLWSTLGIEAKKKDTLQKTEEKVVQPKKQLRKKPRAYAYVNPWHRI